MAKATVMRHLNRHTTMPGPIVLDAVPGPKGALVLMTRLPGHVFTLKEFLSLTDAQRSALASDLKRSFDQLRALPRPTASNAISAFDGGPFFCYRIEEGVELGPFETKEAFYDYMFTRISLKEHPRLRALTHDIHSTEYRLVLTHGDLSLRNIPIDENRRLTDIVDWECAAWMPAYWEYMSAIFKRNKFQPYKLLIDEALETFPAELSLGNAVQPYSTFV